MLRLRYSDIIDSEQRAQWEAAGIALPCRGLPAVAGRTAENPAWLHFGAGNILRSFIAPLADSLLDSGLADTGIIAAEAFDYDIIDKIYSPFDNLGIRAGMCSDGTLRLKVVASVTEAIRADVGIERLREIFRKPSLQMASFTITEKGYALADIQGNLTQTIREDMSSPPERARHVMALVTALLFERFRAGGAKLALVSMDNCSRNGERFRGSVITVAKAWMEHGFVNSGFVSYIEDENTVSFPWSMIDKITPRPSEEVKKTLERLGVEDMSPIVTSRGTFIAPFANAEIPQYLVIEDNFPAGRPPLEKADVYFTDRDTVNKAETMKVCTCLNPLHTALAICGCLMKYKTIAGEMQDSLLVSLVKRIGYSEGLPTVEDPKIFSPREFLREVLEERFPNPFIPDTPQRIVTDSSQKIPIRFGVTLKAYEGRPEGCEGLVGIPLAIAAWFRYLLGVDDELNPIELSGDPMMEELKKGLEGIVAGEPCSYRGQLKTFLSNKALFAVDLAEAGLAGKVESYFVSMLKGAGAVRDTLEKNLNRPNDESIERSV
ncbi:MAG: mannitol dehydrogenase family protein [Synergistaceae bacterium]|jgi:fructuronate reductase|nr:mannitol dehydrogenase family protein [Synergistaceae bacterium]